MKTNIAELLKGCPKGMELDCLLFGEPVTCINVHNGGTYQIVIKTSSGEQFYLTKEGYLYDRDDSKCILFPKGKTTWEGFVPPYEFKEGDIVVTGSIYKCVAIFKNTKSFYDSEGFNYHTLIPLYTKEATLKTDDWIDGVNIRLATEEEKQKLFKAIKENGYRWDAEKKTLEKLTEPQFKVGDKITNGETSLRIGYIDDEYYYDISKNLASRLPIKYQDKWNLIPKKFDINTLKPFNQVLARCSTLEKWRIQLFEKYDKTCRYPFICMGYNKYKQCVPYEGNEYLLDTADDCDDYYKIWE